MVLITKDYIYCCNLGDSRTVLAEKIKNNRVEIIELSEDHKPMKKAEKERIQAQGGIVDYNRINGKIAIARAIGDWEYKDGKLAMSMAR